MIRCERHPDREAEEVCITVGGTTACVDLCRAECIPPLLELMEMGRPAVEPGSTPKFPRSLTTRIRGVPNS